MPKPNDGYQRAQERFARNMAATKIRIEMGNDAYSKMNYRTRQVLIDDKLAQEGQPKADYQADKSWRSKKKTNKKPDHPNKEPRPQYKH